jgi:hypothetical protein
MEQQTSYIKRNASKTANNVICFINLLNTVWGIEDSRFRLAEDIKHENKHIAIISNESWRCGHGFDWYSSLKCKINIDVLKDEEPQKIFSNLFAVFETNENWDELTNKFYNALVIFNKALQQLETDRDDSLALLLLLTAAESLLTEEKNEKRLRLCSVLSRLSNVEGITRSELAKSLDASYLKRNNFVHAGISSLFCHDDRNLDYLQQAVAQLILKYFEVDKLITKRDKDESRSNAWNRYIDEIFTTILY